jgi:glutamate-1-semialdehyde 2,1-aminomutase
MRAGIATLNELSKRGSYEAIDELAKKLVAGLRTALANSGVAAQVNSIGSLSTIFFAPQPVANYVDAKRSDTKVYGRFFREMLNRGILLAPSQFEAAFVSAAHTNGDIDRTIIAASDALKATAEPAPE